MQFRNLSLICLAAILSLGHCANQTTNEKASSPLINCGCQCSSLTFRDAGGVVQGNCLTVDSTGAQWCYVDPAYSSCQDLVPSQRFPNNPWSYEACATPSHTSPVCLGVPAPVLPVAPVAPVAPAVPVVPVEPVHPPVHPTYPLPQPHPVAPSSVAGVGGQAQTIQEIFGANGGYDPETIGEPRHGDASSKNSNIMEDTKIDYLSVMEILHAVDYVCRTEKVYLDQNNDNDDGEDLDAGELAQNNPGIAEDNSDGVASGEENGGMEEEDAYDKLDRIVVRLKGLTDLLSPMTTAQKNEFLDNTLMLSPDQRLAYDALELIHFEFFCRRAKIEKSFLVMMKTTITAIVDIINEQVLHPAMKAWSKACEDFLAESFKLCLSFSFEIRHAFFRLINSFVMSWKIGSLYISLVLKTLHETGELLLYQNYSSGSETPSRSAEDFLLYRTLALHLLTAFERTAQQMLGLEGGEVRDSLNVPKISLGEIRKFGEKLCHWGNMTESTVLTFADINPNLSSEMQKVQEVICKLRVTIFRK